MQRQLLISLLFVFSNTLLADSSIKSNTAAALDISSVEAEEAQDENNALYELCQSYAQDEKIKLNQQEAYIQDCLSSMTDINESLVFDTSPPTDNSDDLSDEHAAAMRNDKLKTETPESLISTEIVSKPDPKAEQLNTN